MTQVPISCYFDRGMTTRCMEFVEIRIILDIFEPLVLLKSTTKVEARKLTLLH